MGDLGKAGTKGSATRGGGLVDGMAAVHYTIIPALPDTWQVAAHAIAALLGVSGATTAGHGLVTAHLKPRNHGKA